MNRVLTDFDFGDLNFLLSGWQVSQLASEAKKEKSTLTKEISKISNYGISVWETLLQHFLIYVHLSLLITSMMSGDLFQD